MDNLYSDDPIVREEEAAKYRTFHKEVVIPGKWKKYWDRLLDGRDVSGGLTWPKDLQLLVRSRKWPEFTFGSANASCLVVMHRPGITGSRDLLISPTLPVLGGIPHAHNAFYYPNEDRVSPTWGALHRYLEAAFARLKHPWSQVMTTNLTTTLAGTGQVDSKANLRAVNGGLLDFLTSLCQPRLVLLCGGEVRKAAAKWSPPPHVEVLECDHPSYQYWSRDGARVQKTIEKVLFS